MTEWYEEAQMRGKHRGPDRLLRWSVSLAVLALAGLLFGQTIVELWASC